jgi:hypothetical protein
VAAKGIHYRLANIELQGPTTNAKFSRYAEKDRISWVHLYMATSS